MNSFIQAYRAKYPDDTSTDEELILHYGDNYPDYAYPQDFKADYQKLKTQQAVSQSSVATELGRGVKRGLYGLGETAVGLGALGADVLGVDQARDYLLKAYKDIGAKSAEQAPADVPTVQQAITSPRAALHYIAGKAGELIPNVGEAVAAGVAGSMLAPGPGTAAGAAEGFFGSAAAKTAINRLIKTNPIVRKELEDYASGKIASEALSETAKTALDQSAKYIGANVSSMANFAAQGAGGSYGALAQTPGVSDQDAIESAVLAGMGSSVGALIPAGILKHIFPGVGEEAAKSYVDLWAKKVPKEVLTAGGGMGAMEFFNILAEKHADPKKRDKEFTDEDWSRLLNAFTVGVLASGPAVGLTALKGVEAKETLAEPPPPAKPPDQKGNVPGGTISKTKEPEPAPAMTSKEINRTFPTDLTPEQRLAMEQVVQRDISGQMTEADKTYLADLPEVHKAVYNTLKQEAQDATQVRKESDDLRQQRERDDAQLRQEGQNRDQQAKDQEEGAQAGAGDSLQQNARRIEQALGIPDGELDRKKGEKYQDYVARFVSTYEAASKATQSGERKALPAPVAPEAAAPDEARAQALAAVVGTGEPERVVAASYTNPETGQTTTGESHPDAAAAQGVAAPESRAARETPEFGFTTNTGRTVDREEAGKIAEASGQKVESPAAKPGEPTHSDTVDPLAWIQTVSPEKTDRGTMPWTQTDRRGAVYNELGNTDTDKQATKIVVVLSKPDGSGVVLGTAYRNRKDMVWLGGKTGVSWEKAMELGYKLRGYFHREERQRDFYREYTTNEWVPIEYQLNEVNSRYRKSVGELPDAITGQEAKEIGAAPAEAGKTTVASPEDVRPGVLSDSDAEFIHNLVEKEPKAFDSLTVIDGVNEALLKDAKGMKELATRLGPKDSSTILGKVFGLYQKVVEEFETEGITSKAKFRERMLKELTGLTGKDKEVPPEEPDQMFSVQSNPSRSKTSSEVVPIAMHVMMRLEKAGIPVNLLQRTTQQVVGAFVDALGRVTGEVSGGMYDRAARMVTWVVNDLTAPTREDLRVLFEEAGHALFDRESVEIKDPILKTMAEMSDRNFGLDEQQLKDLQAAYPVGARPEVMAEEAFMAMLSKRLETEGFNPVQSSGLAQALVRLVKELYLKGAMWVQQNLLGGGYTNSDLAQRYFDNRLRSFLAGDRETLSWIDRLGGGKAQFDQQVRWHNPIGTSEILVQKYNALTGKIDTASFPQDSVQSSLLDIQDDQRFSVQAPGAVPAPVIDPSVRLNRAAATLNDTLDVHDEIAADAKVTPEAFRHINGIKDPNAVKAILAAEVARKGIQGYNPDQRTSGFTHEQNYGPMWVRLFSTLRGEMGKVSRRLVSFKEKREALEKDHDRIITEGGNALKQYLDADLTAAQIARDFKALTIQELKQLRVGARRYGGILREIQQLDGKINAPVDAKVVNALRRLFTGSELTGTTLFNLLDTMANDPSIDFDWSPAQIRASIRDRVNQGMVYGPYERLTQDTPESRALLGTVIYYGKTRDRIMAQLQMRRMESGEERAQLEQQLKDLWKETSQQITQGVRRVAYSAKIQDRARIAYRKQLREAIRAKENMQRLDDAIKMNESAIPHYQKALDKIAAKRGFAQETSFGNGMVLSIPKSNAAAGGFDDFKIQLSAAADEEITSPAKLQEILDKQSAWLLARENEAKAGSQTALGLDYQRVKRQRDELAANVDYQARLRNTDHGNTELMLSSGAKQMDAMGTPSASLLSKMVKSYAALNVGIRVQAERLFGYMNPRLKQKVIGVLSAGRKAPVDPEWFESEIASPSIGFLTKWVPSEDPRVSVEQSTNQAYAALGNWLLGHDHLKPLIQNRMPQFMAALREMIEAREKTGQWFVDKNEAYGMKIMDPKTGLLRSPHKIGLVTIPQRFAKQFFTMMNALAGSGWATNGVDEQGAYGEFKNVAELYAKDRPKLDAMLARYFRNPVFGDAVQRDFLYSLAHNPDETPFFMPIETENEAKVPADPASVARAYDESVGHNGLDVIGMFEKLYQLEGGQGDVGAYVQDCLMQLADQFKEADSVKRKMTASGDVSVSSLQNVVPNAMIDARKYTAWPAEWFEYHQFDRNDISRLSERVAGQLTFGRDSERLASLHSTLKGDVDSMVADLHTVLNDARKLSPSGKEKEIEKHAVRILANSPSPALQQFKTGEQRLAFLRKIEKRAKFVDKFRDDLNLYFKRHNDPSNSLQWGIRVAQELASLLVNQPGSAISQLATVFDIPIQWGASPIMLGRTARTVALTAKDIAGSLAQAVGVRFLPLSFYEEKFRKLYQDPEAARKAGDIFLTMEGEAQNKAARAFRIARDVQSFPVNQLGIEARYTPLRPLAPFFQTVNSTNRALTVSLWEMADRFVAKGLDYLKTHPGADKITGKELDLGRWDQDGFDRWSRDINRYGLKFEDMVKEAKSRMDAGDRTLLTDKQLSLLYGIGLNEISLESNIGTMPLNAFNNRILRFVIPLQGWSFRRTMQLLDRRLDEKDQNNLKTARNALLGLAATMVGGLGVSLAVDAYQEEILGKRRNIRNLQLPTTGQDWIAINERLARVGSLGMFGDLSNNLIGMGTGQGDNRAFSIDQRVVALQGLQGLLKSVNSFINQNFDADYKDVVRPAIASVGGNGMLQYMQMVNRAFGLDNVESRTIKRINAENYLRVAGRDTGMQVRGGSGSAAFTTPTPITPWLGRMEYAAFANDPDGFREAYNGAVEQARKSGHPDNAQDYIRKAFETRHPLKYVFSVTPSHNDYLKLLGSMSEDGKEDVKDAIRLFNHYAQSIGINPFEGSVKKDQPKALDVDKLNRARLRAVMGSSYDLIYSR